MANIENNIVFDPVFQIEEDYDFEDMEECKERTLINFRRQIVLADDNRDQYGTASIPHPMQIRHESKMLSNQEQGAANQER